MSMSQINCFSRSIFAHSSCELTKVFRILLLCLIILESTNLPQSVNSQLDGDYNELLPVSWYWNSMIHNKPAGVVYTSIEEPDSSSGSSSSGIASSGSDEAGAAAAYKQEELFINNELEFQDENIPREDLQKYLLLLFDWNWEMSPLEWRYYCRGKMPDMAKMTENMSRYEFFYDMNPSHMGVVLNINKELNAKGSAIEAIRLAACMRDDPSMNTNAWLRGLMMTMVNGAPELRALHVPPMLEVMPSMFIKTEAINEAKRQARFIRPDARQCVPVNGNLGSDNGIENLLWYWREDVWVNSFHWYWHLTYPFMGQDVRGDRRGELLYYSHHSICARYHAERLSVGLPTVEAIEIFPGQTTVELPYNPHLGDTNSGVAWTPRRANSLVQDVSVTMDNGQQMTVDLRGRVRQLQLISQAIEAGVAITREGIKIPLRTVEGIDLLGDMLEASVYTLNSDLYGYPGPHNDAHVALGLIEDPQGVQGLPPGVMADPSVAMRDPIFYRYHVQVDSIFDRYKSTLPPYQPSQGEFPLIYPGVQVIGVAVVPYGGLKPNRLQTFFNEKMYDLARGLDFNRSTVDGPITTCVKHLDYQKFNYEIMIKRDAIASGRATVRIYLAPRYNEHGRRYTMDEQRTLYFPMDRFPVFLAPGLNKIIRKSTESTLTVPFTQSYSNLQSDLANETPFCGCGWPEHLLIPRGSPSGLAFDLVVMVTNGDEDAVPSVKNSAETASGQAASGCQPAPIFCGIVGENYPDSRPMGYPFDRRPYVIDDPIVGVRRLVASIDEFVIGIPNMGTLPIRIFHKSDEDEGNISNFLSSNSAEDVITPLPQNSNLVSCVPYKYRYLCYLRNNQLKKR